MRLLLTTPLAKPFRLLTREQFRAKVFLRDKGRCVMCPELAVDPHHIYERKLWGATGGYYLENGVSLCATHHLQAEEGVLTCEVLRAQAGILKWPLPPELVEGKRYDKWGK